jgi:hypothetical protein
LVEQYPEREGQSFRKIVCQPRVPRFDDGQRSFAARRAIWGTIGLIGLVMIAVTFVTPLRIEWRSFAASVLCGVLIGAAGWFIVWSAMSRGSPRY